MFLHDAIVKALKEIKNPMTTTEIANVLNEKKWYEKKNNNPIISAYQIYGRTKNYPHLFDLNGSMVSLRKNS